MIYSFQPFGYEGSLVTVESEFQNGSPAIDIVGISDCVVMELRERCKSAVKNSGLPLFGGKILVCFFSADIRKVGERHDLSAALSMVDHLIVRKTVTDKNRKILIVGGIELNGNVRATMEIFAACQTAKDEGIFECIVSSQQTREAELAGMKTIHGVKNLREAFQALGEEE